MSTKTKDSLTHEGITSYESWRNSFLADPENRQIYAEEATKKELLNDHFLLFPPRYAPFARAEVDPH